MTANLLYTLKQDHTTLQEQITQITTQLQHKSKQLIAQAFSEFFEKYSGIVDSIFWTQYTPYFNDGEACEFSVHDARIMLVNDKHACEYEGSMLYSDTEIEDLKQGLDVIKLWQQDKLAAAALYRQNSIAKRGYDPFAEHSYGYKTISTQEQIDKWTPYYEADELEQIIEHAMYINEKAPSLATDFASIVSIIRSIDNPLMKTLFGDHVLVTVRADGIETEEYMHD